MLSRGNAPYRPHLWSHDISKTQMWSVQAPDTHHQAPYQTLVLCMLCLNLTLSWCEDSGCFPPEVSETATWDAKSDGTTESKMMKYYNGPVRLHCPISYPIDSSRYLGIWLDLTTTHGQTWFHINILLNRPPDSTWRRPPGRPRNKWFDQLWNDSTRLIGDLWKPAVDRGHGGATTRRPSLATRQWWWCIGVYRRCY